MQKKWRICTKIALNSEDLSLPNAKTSVYVCEDVSYLLRRHSNGKSARYRHSIARVTPPMFRLKKRCWSLIKVGRSFANLRSSEGINKIPLYNFTIEIWKLVTIVIRNELNFEKNRSADEHDKFWKCGIASEVAQFHRIFYRLLLTNAIRLN